MTIGNLESLKTGWVKVIDSHPLDQSKDPIVELDPDTKKLIQEETAKEIGRITGESFEAVKQAFGLVNTINQKMTSEIENHTTLIESIREALSVQPTEVTASLTKEEISEVVQKTITLLLTPLYDQLRNQTERLGQLAERLGQLENLMEQIQQEKTEQMQQEKSPSRCSGAILARLKNIF